MPYERIDFKDENEELEGFLNYGHIESLIKDDINNMLVKAFIKNNI